MIPPLTDNINGRFLEFIGWSEPCPSRLWVITGRNGAGKSLLRRMVGVACKTSGIECLHISVEGRSGDGGGMKSLIYGDEETEATGLLTASTIITGFNTVRNRETPCLLMWDEPEIGMSEELQLGVIKFISEQIADWPEMLQGLVFTTHSRIMARGLVECGGEFVNLFNQFPTLDSWLSREVAALDLQTAVNEGFERFRAFSQIRNQKSA